MKKISIILFAFCTLFGGLFAQEKKIIKVLTFNVLHGATTKGDFNLDLIAQVIKDSEADFVALQEVDFKTGRGRGFDLATELGLRTKMAPIFGKAIPFDGGEYGCGILSKYSYLSTRSIILPYTKGKEARVAVEAVVVLPSKDTIAIVSTHLDHIEGGVDRVNQVKKINEIFSKNTYPTILAGDINAEPGADNIEILENVWGSDYDRKNQEFTFSSDKPVKKIDYVMYLPKKRKWKVVETKTICDPIASDHCAYLVTLELLN